ncbi:MAG: ZIP family metal transporter [Burkholderiales bacterium 68-12]|nr:MAG: ZIP family metal transporter [Burkholderiales bacterium 68-12]
MVLIAIIAATLAAGIGSVWLAAWLMHTRLGARPGGASARHLLSMAAGALLATAFMQLLPEAFEGHVGAESLFATLLVGLVFFFLLDKAELWHHGHEHSQAASVAAAHAGHAHAAHEHAAHEHAGDGHHHGHAHPPAGGGWTVLTGDSLHCFGDGIMIASAFLADLRLGLVAALSVLAHEVPHHMGDLVVLRQSSASRRIALLKVSLAGAVTALGGIAGYFLVSQLHDGLPFFLTVAASSFIYVALADLIPQLQRHLSARETVQQIVWLLLGMGMVMLVSSVAHSHAH